MLEEFKNHIAENNLFRPSDKILLAVSGGIDSMVMTHLFMSISANIGIAHCNFNLRGIDSEKDEEFVRKFADKNGIPFYNVSFDTTGYAAEKGISIQMAARELRYQWFEETRKQNGYDLISLAHNMNDNVETFIINLTRGTGIAGLTGMRPLFRNLVRPLLFASRSAISEYSARNKIAYREDRSNSDTKYIRNKIRHEILPLLREINPSFDITISETADRFGDIYSIVTEYISEIRKKAASSRDNMVIIKLKEIKGLSPKRTILYELFRPYGIVPGQLNDLLSLSEGKTGSVMMTRTSRLVKNRNEIIIVPAIEDSGKTINIESPADFLKVPGCISASVNKIEGSFRISSSPKTACLDAAKVRFPMVVRYWRQGDYFYPLGMSSRKKLSDYFIDMKYSLPEKEKQLILEADGKIVWLIGNRIDNRFRITDKSRKVLVIEFS
jgi:tRNA(Ile)-lysidine synthase